MNGLRKKKRFGLWKGRIREFTRDWKSMKILKKRREVDVRWKEEIRERVKIEEERARVRKEIKERCEQLML